MGQGNMFYLVNVKHCKVFFVEMGLRCAFEDGEIFCCPDLYYGAKALVSKHVCEDIWETVAPGEK